MTGEISLRGTVLPVGGVKEKVLAAHRAGLKRVILPERNRKDLVDIPKEIRDELQLLLVSTIEEVIDLALKPASKTTRKRMSSPDMDQASHLGT